MRIEFPNGDWADFADRLTYAGFRRVQEADDRAAAGVAVLVTGWAIRDVEDNAIPFPARDSRGIPMDALDDVPLETFADLAATAAEILSSEMDKILPKGTGRPSPASATAPEPPSPMSLPTPTSSRTSRAGRTTISNGHPLT